VSTGAYDNQRIRRHYDVADELDAAVKLPSKLGVHVRVQRNRAPTQW
jgi:hypothetical protein